MFEKEIDEIYELCVVPHAGTWIEIMLHMKILYKVDGRSPRGNVD